MSLARVSLAVFVFAVLSCTPRSVFFADPVVEAAAPQIVVAWKGSGIGGASAYQRVEANSAVAVVEQALSDPHSALESVLLGFPVPSEQLRSWVGRFTNVRFGVLMPDQPLPEGCVGFLPDRKRGWKELALEAARSTSKSSFPSVVVLKKGEDPELSAEFSQGWRTGGSPSELTFLSVEDAGGESLVQAQKKIVSTTPAVFLLAGGNNSKFPPVVSAPTLVATEFPPIGVKSYYDLALTFDESALGEVLAKGLSDREKKVVLLPLKTQKTSR